MGGFARGGHVADGLNGVANHHTFFEPDEIPVVSGMFFPVGVPGSTLGARAVLHLNHAHAMMKEGYSGVVAKIDLA